MYSAADKLAAVERELALRRRVYANQVSTHRMTQHFADVQIALFEEIAADYRDQANAEQLL